MNGAELNKVIEGRLASLPDRTTGEESYDYLVGLIRPYSEDSRPALVEFLRSWLRQRDEYRSIAAVDLAAEFHIDELYADISELLSGVECGEIFLPALKSYYVRRISERLSAIS